MGAEAGRGQVDRYWHTLLDQVPPEHSRLKTTLRDTLRNLAPSSTGRSRCKRSRCPAMMPIRDPSRLVLTSDRPGDGVAVVGIGSKTLNLLSSVPIEVADKLHLMLLGIMWEA